MPDPLPPAALDLLRPFRDAAFVQDCREKWFERMAIATLDGLLSEHDAEAVALADLVSAIERRRNASP